MPRWGNFPAFPPGRYSPSELYSRHSGGICKLAVFFFLIIKQSCHCLNRSSEASTLQRSVLQSDASEGRDAPAQQQIQAPPAPQLIIHRRGRSDRSQWRLTLLTASIPVSVLPSFQSSPPAVTPHTPHASTWKIFCYPPQTHQFTLPKPTSPAPARRRSPPPTPQRMHTLLPFF